jgi:hypothetical protein
LRQRKSPALGRALFGRPSLLKVGDHAGDNKTLSACGADGSCSKLDNLKGEKLPVKVTIDFALGIVAGVDPDGWVNATRIGSLARTPDQLILQRIDDAVAWQLLIYKKSQIMSFALASADSASIGFGDCTVVKEQ